MKFLAILRDSLRETLDVKLFYVLVGLSVVVILFVMSITYKPEPMETQVKPVLGLTAFGIINDFQTHEETRGLIARPEESNFEQLDKGKEPWQSDHRFTLTFTLSVDHGDDNPFLRKHKGAPAEGDAHVETEKERDKVAAGKAQLTPEYVQKMLKGSVFFIKDFDVEPAKVEGDADNQVAFDVTTHGTIFKSRKEWFHKPALFFGAVDVPVPLVTLGTIIQFIGDWIVGTFGTSIIMFLSTIMTASFLPTMLNKGTVDLLLVKPIHRTSLFLYKFAGGLMFMFLNTAVIMGGIWLALGIQTGLWTNSLLLCVLIYTFQFATFYAVSAFAAVFTRSAIVAILASVIMWVFLFALGWTHWVFIEKGRDTKPPSTTGHWAFVAFDALHTVMPHYKDIDWLTTREIKEDIINQLTSDKADREKAYKDLDKDYGAYHWGTSLLVSGLFIVVVVGLACWRFATKDY
ncbi:MAG TPA: ABC transporter permease [Gemmataceae bacterium]|nr:ABC transporter permease [Gemmataceae bacterium]